MIRIVLFILLIGFGISNAQSNRILLLGGTAHLGSGEEIGESYIVIKDGRYQIVKSSLGMQYNESDFDEIIDCAGKHIYPQLITSNSEQVQYPIYMGYEESDRDSSVYLSQVFIGNVELHPKVLHVYIEEDFVGGAGKGLSLAELEWELRMAKSGVNSHFSDVFNNGYTLLVHADLASSIASLIQLKSQLRIPSLVISGGYDAVDYASLLREYNIGLLYTHLGSNPLRLGDSMMKIEQDLSDIEEAGVKLAVDADVDVLANVHLVVNRKKIFQWVSGNRVSMLNLGHEYGIIAPGVRANLVVYEEELFSGGSKVVTWSYAAD